MSKLVDKMQAELCLSCMTTLSPKLPRTSGNFVLAKMDLDIKDVGSIESSPISWLREETSLLEMELEENLSMVPNLLMRTLRLDMKSHIFCQWPMLDPTPMDPNFSSPSLNAPGLMESTVSSEKSLKENRLLMPCTNKDPITAKPKYQ